MPSPEEGRPTTLTAPDQAQGRFSTTIRRLWPYAGRYWPWFLTAIVATVILNFANLIRPHLLKILMDEVLNPKVVAGGALQGKTTLLFMLLAGLFGATAVKGLFTYVQGLTMVRATQSTVRDLREDVYDHVQRLPVTWFDRNRTGDLIVRFSDDLRVTIEFMTTGLMGLCNETIILVTSISWMVTKDWKLTVVGMIVSPMAGMAVRRFSKRMSHATETAQKSLSNLSSLVQETVSGIKVVKAFSKERHEGDRFKAHNEDNFRWAMRIVQYTATQSPIVEVLATGGIALVLWYCTINILVGDLTLGDLMAFWAYMLMATTPINRLPQTMTNIEKGCTAVDRVLSLRDEPSEEELAARHREATARSHGEQAPVLSELPPVSGRIEIRNLRFRYQEGREEALRGIDLTIAAGEHVAVVGRNGAGKSTLVNLIPRYYELQEGDILLDGTSIRNVTIRSLRSQIGIVAQDTFLFSGTIRSNIAYGKEDATSEEIETAARAAGVHDFVTAFASGYDTLLGERGGGLSGGQRQRIAVARMLLKNPPIVILDEATSNMDPESERALQDSLDVITRGRTVISIAHRLIASRGADRIVVLEQGQVAETGTHGELLAAQGRYYQLHCSLMGVEA